MQIDDLFQILKSGNVDQREEEIRVKLRRQSTCYGFDACVDVAEQTPNSGRQIPKAMRMTIYV